MAFPIINPASNGTAPFTPGGYQPSTGVSTGLQFNSKGVFSVSNPNFGGRLQEYLFEAINDQTFEALEMRIRDDINTYWNNTAQTAKVVIQDISVLGNEDYNKIKIELTYWVNGELTTSTISHEMVGEFHNKISSKKI